MPKCGSQIALCDVPIRFDTYKGCGHGCTYCFAAKKTNIKEIGGDENATALRSFIGGKRSGELTWCDWDIPLHWGGMSDPFQPIERVRGRSLDALKVFAETGYPFIVSTKNALVAEEPYLSWIKQCNCVVQFSAVTPRYDCMEKGASTYAERIAAAAKIAPYKRVNIRVQPYLPAIVRDLLAEIPHYGEIGIHGIILEGMKYQKSVVDGLVKVGGDYCYPLDILLPQFSAIKKACHDNGLKFYCGENRLRALGDELCCCGVEGLGWKVNTANLNHALFDGENFKYTEKMGEVGTALAWAASKQDTISVKELKLSSYREVMDKATGNPYQYHEGAPTFTAAQATRLRLYLCDQLKKAGKRPVDIDKHLGTFMGRHYFAKSQWAFPTLEAYEKLREIIPTLGEYYQVLRQVGGVSLARKKAIYGK